MKQSYTLPPLTLDWSVIPVTDTLGPMFQRIAKETCSRIVDPEKKAYLVRNKNPSVIWILNDQNSSKWSLEGF